MKDSMGGRLATRLPGILPWIWGTLSFTLLVLWAGLLWSAYRARWAPVPLLTAEEMLDLEPRQFERHVELLFRHKGFRVRHRGGSGDHGVDLEVYARSGRKGVVQCKRYRATVGEEVVRGLYGTMLHEGAAHAFLATPGEISEAARTWAQGKPITLVDGKLLVHLARTLAR